MNKEIREIVRAVVAQGYSIEQRNNHYLLKSREGGTIFSLPSSPGRGRWKQNLISELRKRGVVI